MSNIKNKIDNNNLYYRTLREDVDPKIEFLKKQNLYFEAFLFCAISIESLLKEVVLLQEELINKSLSGHNLLKFQYKIKSKDFEKMTLGQLINKFSRYAKIDKYVLYQLESEDIFFKELNAFGKFRNKCVHGVFEHSLDSLNTESQAYIDNFFILIGTIISYHVRLLKLSIANLSQESES